MLLFVLFLFPEYRGPTCLCLIVKMQRKEEKRGEEEERFNKEERRRNETRAVSQQTVLSSPLPSADTNNSNSIVLRAHANERPRRGPALWWTSEKETEKEGGEKREDQTESDTERKVQRNKKKQKKTSGRTRGRLLETLREKGLVLGNSSCRVDLKQ